MWGVDYTWSTIPNRDQDNAKDWWTVITGTFVEFIQCQSNYTHTRIARKISSRNSLHNKSIDICYGDATATTVIVAAGKVWFRGFLEKSHSEKRNYSVHQRKLKWIRNRQFSIEVISKSVTTSGNCILEMSEWDKIVDSHRVNADFDFSPMKSSKVADRW